MLIARYSVSAGYRHLSLRVIYACEGKSGNKYVRAVI